jgi:hypothetical protein
MIEWISVKTSIPDEGKIVLVSDGMDIVRGLISNKKISPHFYGGWVNLEPLRQFITHWMPLPEVPHE